MANQLLKSRVGEGKALNGQSREIISNVYAFMKEEASKKMCTIPMTKARERTAAATGVSVRVVSKINKELETLKSREDGHSKTFSTPGKHRKKSRPITDLDDFDKGVLRRLVYDFHVTKKRLPTAELLRAAMQEATDFRGGVTSMKKILKQIGFQWKKTENNRKLLVERLDIREKRISYLTQIKRYREEGRPVVYMDESYVLSSHVAGKIWADTSGKGLHAPVSKGDRLIIIHAGGEKGFVPNALTMWKAGQSSGDYHHQMNKNNFEKWVKDRLLPNLEPRSVLVIDNAPYHNIECDDYKVPTTNSKKSEMAAWLNRQGIPHSDDMLKPQLYRLIQLHKPTNKRFFVDELLQREGHSVLRLPPYHPELNPIELIWAEVKSHIARNNVSFATKDVKDICEQKLSEMGQEDWAFKCRHVKKIEEEYVLREPVIDSVIDSFVIRLGDDDDDENEDNADDSDNSTDEESGADMSGIEELH
jgi:transposase